MAVKIQYRKGKTALRSLLAMGLVSLVISACQPALVPVAYPTPAILTVQSTPALEPLKEAYSACAQEMENTGLVLLDAHASSMNAPGMDLKQADLALRWGPGSAAKDFTFVVGQETLAVIVHPQNPRASLSLADLQAVFLGARRAWPQSEPPEEIHPWVYLNGDDAQDIFETIILGGQAASARVVSRAPDPAAMREAVAADPAAIGFLPRRWLDASVKALSIEGLDPALLQQPILAISRAEPQGMEKSWLLCLQGKISK